MVEQNKCNKCGYNYNPKDGDPERGVEPGTPFSDLPANWQCPSCGNSKINFEEVALGNQ